MDLRFDLAAAFERELAEAALRAGLTEAGFTPDVRPADPVHGDFQANGVLAYAKRQRQNPRALAEALVQQLGGLAALTDIAIAGPGFINFKLKPATLLDWLRAHGTRDALAAGASAAEQGHTVVVDYSSPNTAKQMHVGHLRSAVIGEAISRLLQFSGAQVIRDNHVGDWGTQFGKLIWAYKRHLDPAALARDPLEEFERLYKVGHHAAEADPAVLREAQQELVKLQAHDPENLSIWRRINEASLAAFQEIYNRLGIRFDAVHGESFYNDRLEQVYGELAACGLAEESEGALVVFHPEHPRFKAQPFIIRKSDGAANYATTDLATILYRTEHFRATSALYVVDKRQADHFAQLFLTAKKWFEKTDRALPRLEHVDFGTVLGEDGRPLKTRSGENIRLKDLLDEAVERSYRLVSEKNPELAEEERRAIARIVGVGSVQYADLSQNRSSDYLFAWDKLISLDGNTAAYLLYAVARIHSIFRKLGLRPGDAAPEAGATPFETPAESTLARKLVRFPDALAAATGNLRPHFLCTYLYELAGEFSTFYNADKVAVDAGPVRARRLMLCNRTLLVLETGLQLLGLRLLTKM
ncbi:MAG: arginine--tRNA ligase [Opitutaceae bacterium]